MSKWPKMRLKNAVATNKRQEQNVPRNCAQVAGSIQRRFSVCCKWSPVAFRVRTVSERMLRFRSKASFVSAVSCTSLLYNCCQFLGVLNIQDAHDIGKTRICGFPRGGIDTTGCRIRQGTRSVEMIAVVSRTFRVFALDSPMVLLFPRGRFVRGRIKGIFGCGCHGCIGIAFTWRVVFARGEYICLPDSWFNQGIDFVGTVGWAKIDSLITVNPDERTLKGRKVLKACRPSDAMPSNPIRWVRRNTVFESCCEAHIQNLSIRVIRRSER